MRRMWLIGPLAFGLVLATAGAGLAQENEPAGETLRVAVPEAGVAAAFPVTWAADVEMREREDHGLHDEGYADDPVPFWNVIYASAGGRPWCDLVWYPQHPLVLAAHVQRLEALMTPTIVDVERSIEVEAVSLPAGEAYSFVVYNEPTDDYTKTYLLGVDDARYLLQCAGDERAPDDWLALAESLELLAATEENDAGG